MKIKKTTEVTVLTERVLIVRRKPLVEVGCPECGGALMRPDEAARVFGTRTRDIYRGIENGNVHFLELANGEMLVCCK